MPQTPMRQHNANWEVTTAGDRYFKETRTDGRWTIIVTVNHDQHASAWTQ